MLTRIATYSFPAKAAQMAHMRGLDFAGPCGHVTLAERHAR